MGKFIFLSILLVHEIITHISTDQIFWIQVVQHLHQQHLPGLPKVVEIMWLEPTSPKATLPVKFLQAPGAGLRA